MSSRFNRKCDHAYAALCRPFMLAFYKTSRKQLSSTYVFVSLFQTKLDNFFTDNKISRVLQPLFFKVKIGQNLHANMVMECFSESISYVTFHRKTGLVRTGNDCEIPVLKFLIGITSFCSC